MSLDVVTLALAKSYTNQHGGDGGGENTIYIPATLKESGDTPIIETSVTFEQVDAAYKSGKEQILELSMNDGDYRLLSLVVAVPGILYYFGVALGNGSMLALTSADGWSFNMYDLTPTPKQEIVNDVLAALPTWTGGSY